METLYAFQMVHVENFRQIIISLWDTNVHSTVKDLAIELNSVQGCGFIEHKS